MSCQMRLIAPVAILVVLLCLGGCGANTTSLLKGLDTPEHHVANGQRLMGYGKIDAALREFRRAKELDPAYSPAYVGLGLVAGCKGDFDAARLTMNKAQSLARSAAEMDAVRAGFVRLDPMEKNQ